MEEERPQDLSSQALAFVPPQVLLRRANVTTDRISDDRFESSHGWIEDVLIRMKSPLRSSSDILMMSQSQPDHEGMSAKGQGGDLVTRRRPAAPHAGAMASHSWPPASARHQARLQAAAEWNAWPVLVPQPAAPRPEQQAVPTVLALRAEASGDAVDVMRSTASLDVPVLKRTARLGLLLNWRASSAYCDGKRKFPEEAFVEGGRELREVHSELDSVVHRPRQWPSQSRVCVDCRPLLGPHRRWHKYCFCQHRHPELRRPRLPASAQLHVQRRELQQTRLARVRRQELPKLRKWRPVCLHGCAPARCGICRPCPHGQARRACLLCSSCSHGRLRESCSICSPCRHGLSRLACYQCSSCKHGRLRVACPICRGCVHGRLLWNCPQCRGCPHGRLKAWCDECSPCEHGKAKLSCPQCWGCPHGLLSRFCRICRPCEHGRRKDHCPECKGCRHGKLSSNCLICSGCPHGRVRRFCPQCRPCPHGKRKQSCKLCSACPHGRIGYSCAECKGCPHGAVRRFCKLCNGCPHGRLRRDCKLCRRDGQAVAANSPGQ